MRRLSSWSALLALLLATAAPLPPSALAQGTAPAQGAHQPAAPPPPGDPPAPAPEHMSDGLPRPDPGGGAARTGPETTASTPLPAPGQANPPSTAEKEAPSTRPPAR
jgi:hypothetical protein